MSSIPSVFGAIGLSSIWRLARSFLVVGAVTFFLFACSSSPGGNAQHGEELYATSCAACHAWRENSMGPMHCGLFDRPAASVSGYTYSEAMEASGIVWNAQTLNDFLLSPIAYVVGTNMGFVGFPDPADRADIIAYLQQATSDAEICPQS